MAAPSKYFTHILPKLDLIVSWARAGLTEAEIATKLNVALRSMLNYKDLYPEFKEALQNGKDEADYKVEDTLYNRAIGMHYYEEHEDIVLDKKTGDKTLTLTKRVKKYLPPDTTAMIFWLKNRKRETWRDGKDINVSGNVKLEDFFKE